MMTAFKDARQKLYRHVGFVEDWVVYPIDDRTEMFWRVDKDEREFVRYGETPEGLDSPDDEFYEEEIYTQRFYKKWVFRGKKLTMVMVDTHVDGNKFFAFFSNDKEVKK